VQENQAMAKLQVNLTSEEVFLGMLQSKLEELQEE